MADFYTQFSEKITGLSAEQVEWLEGEVMTDIAEEIDYSDAWLRERGLDEMYSWPNFEWKAHRNIKDSVISGLPKEIGECSFWVYSQESGNVEHVANLIQRFFKKFNLDWIFTLSWSENCSKPRLSEFGGGACVVTAEKTYWMNTYNWQDKTIKRIENLRKKKQKADPRQEKLPGVL